MFTSPHTQVLSFTQNPSALRAFPSRAKLLLNIASADRKQRGKLLGHWVIKNVIKMSANDQLQRSLHSLFASWTSSLTRRSAALIAIQFQSTTKKNKQPTGWSVAKTLCQSPSSSLVIPRHPIPRLLSWFPMVSLFLKFGHQPKHTKIGSRQQHPALGSQP